MADATFTDVQYQLKRVYRNRGYIANLAYKSDSFMGLLQKRAAKGKVGGQADMVPVQFSGAGVPSNTTGIIGTAAPSQGIQFAVTPVPMTNLMGLDVLAILAGTSDIGAIVKPLKRELDATMMKVGKIASIQLWSNGLVASTSVQRAILVALSALLVVTVTATTALRARREPDTRSALMAVAFLAMSIVLLARVAAMIPGPLFSPGISRIGEMASLPLGALVLALSAATELRQRRRVELVAQSGPEYRSGYPLA